MKKFGYILLFSIITFTSCTLETSDNGKLDGYWHLERIDTLQTGGSKDMTNEKVFWAVQHKLMQLQGDTATYTLRFDETADSLVLKEPYKSGGVSDAGERTDIPLADPHGLQPYGIQNLEEHFFKESLKGSSMVLRSAGFRLYFRKF